MKKTTVTLHFLLCILPLLILPISCKPLELGLYKLFGHGDSVDERVDGLEEVPAPAPIVRNGKFAFLLTSDVHFGNESYNRNDEAFFVLLQELKNTLDPPPSFGVCLGDVVENGGTESEWTAYKAWTERVEGIIGNKVYTTTGNHDLYNEGWEYFEQYAYPYTGFFHFQTSGFSFYFLDTGSGSMGSKQYSLFTKAAKNDSMPKIICTHYPVYGTANFFQNYYTLQNTEEADSLITFFTNNNVKLYLSGHMHALHENELGNFTELVIPCFADNHKFAIVTVDTNANTTTQTIYSY